MTSEHTKGVQVDALARQVRELEGWLGRLDRRVRAIEAGSAPSIPISESPPDVELVAAGPSWLGHSAALRRVATISFVLVVALVLRTLTDASIVDQSLGVWLGVGYAALLMAVGWRRLAQNRPGKRVLTCCGALLLCSLVLETHARFEYLDAGTAHGLLVATLLTSALLGYRYRAPVAAEIGVLAAATTALAIRFPVPEFPVVALCLVLAMLTAVAIESLRPAAWLQWIVLVLQAFFWLLWAVKLHAPLARGEVLPANLRLGWYLPALAATFVVLLAVAWREHRGRSGPYALVLPTWNVLQACAAAAAVMPWLVAPRWFGALALLLAGVHVVLARRFAAVSATSSASLAVAAALCFVPGAWLVSERLALTLPAWSVAAFGLAWWSGRLPSAGLRVMALTLQVGTLLVAVAAGVFAAGTDAPWRAAALAAALAVASGLHYRWTRRQAPPTGSWYERLSPADRPGVLALWACVGAVFCSLRIVLHPLLALLPTDVDNTFAGAQSVLGNTIGITLLVLARRRGSRPVLATAALVVAVAGAKIFVSDFFGVRGLPLVLSVFSFGLAAAVASLVLGRWQRAGAAQ